ncbi:MAG: BMP family lipoprotein [Cellulosilyticaceae bacterium]
MKKLMKKLAAMTALTLMMATVGCGSQPETKPEVKPETSTEAPDATNEEGMKIVIVTSPSGVDDGNFNENNYNGILEFIANNPTATVKTVQEQDMANSVPAVADVVADYDVIVTPGFQFGPVGAIAEENPDKKFILVDSYPSDANGQEIVVDNMYAMQFAEQESGFFAGIAAAKETKTGKVAVVNGVAYPSNVNYQYGFEAGVNYANAKLGTKAEIVEIASYAGTDVTNTNVGGNYVGDFSDPATGKVVASALIAEGVDIMFVAAGGSGSGVFTAAKEATGVKVIGCDVDQFADGVNGSNNIVLTSALKNMALNVNRQLTAIVEGTFAGGNNLLKADTDSTGLVVEAGRHQMADETVTAVEEVYGLVKDGTIVPPSNFSGTTPEDFPGLK